MEFQVVGKGGKYTVQDKTGRLIYSIKKKGFGARYNLMDASNYNLYTLVQTGDSKRPFFTIILNDNVFMYFIVPQSDHNRQKQDHAVRDNQ